MNPRGQRKEAVGARSRSIRIRLAAAAVVGTIRAGGLPTVGAESTLQRAKRLRYVTMGFTKEVPYSYAQKGTLTVADPKVVRVINLTADGTPASTFSEALNSMDRGGHPHRR